MKYCWLILADRTKPAGREYARNYFTTPYVESMLAHFNKKKSNPVCSLKPRFNLFVVPRNFFE